MPGVVVEGGRDRWPSWIRITHKGAHYSIRCIGAHADRAKSTGSRLHIETTRLGLNSDKSKPPPKEGNPEGDKHGYLDFVEYIYKVPFACEVTITNLENGDFITLLPGEGKLNIF